ncbi:MAG TPA: hypothetical protein VIL17_07715 [Coriobacteriia bacterium]
MKIAHLQVSKPKTGERVGAIAAIAARIERLRGVAGVVVVRSMGLLSVLYDERRTDPVVLADAVVVAAEEPGVRVDAPADARLDASTVGQ